MINNVNAQISVALKQSEASTNNTDVLLLLLGK